MSEPITWVPLTGEMAKAGLGKNERMSLEQGEASEPEAKAVIDSLVEDLIAEIRLNVSSGGRARLSSDETLIPQGLKPAAVDILRFRLLSRFANQISQARTDAWTMANETLKAARRGEFGIPEPDGGKEAPDQTPSPHYSGRPIRWGPRVQRGIM